MVVCGGLFIVVNVVFIILVNVGIVMVSLFNGGYMLVFIFVVMFGGVVKVIYMLSNVFVIFELGMVDIIVELCCDFLKDLEVIGVFDV